MNARLNTLFLHARELASADERAAFLDAACAGDPDLRARLEAKLATDEAAAAFFGDGLTRAEPDSHPGMPGERPGDIIGAYRLLEQIGEGGFGTVWMAEQSAPVRRRVALKIIKPGLETKEVIARFEQERQALAMMDHANIARVFDAGATQGGRPFFVMELVRGTKITEYCDEHGLAIPDRIRLFIQVCHAVHHAHQKGIIHRDIKPSNVLVTINDAEAVVKVIDFGVAKATLGSLSDITLFTQFHQMIGTPAYMSPEQAEMTSLDIDTRSDIYSLGVLLYELITGRTPIDTTTLARAGLDEIRRVIREFTPLRPSAKVKSLSSEELTTTAKRRRTDGAKLTTTMRGDLDWIAMMCLEKDRKRRYDSAHALALDLQRYLDHGIVTARPPTASYLLGRIVRRHRVAFITGSAVALSLLVGIAVSTWLYFKEKEAVKEQSRLRGETERALSLAEHEERTAKTETARTKKVTSFLVDMLKGAGPTVAQGRDTTVLREILDATAARLDSEMKDEPMVDAALRHTLGKVYFELGLNRQAEPMFRRAMELYQEYAPESYRAIAVEMDSLGAVLKRRGHTDEAEGHFRSSLSLLQEHCPEERRLIAIGLGHVGMILEERGKLTEAEKMVRDSLALFRSFAQGPDRDVAFALHDLAGVLRRQGHLPESETMHRDALAMRRELFPEGHYDLVSSLSGLGLVLLEQHKPAEAIPLFQSGLDIQEKLFGTDHPETAVLRTNLADAFAVLGELEKAEGMHRKALEILQAKHGAEHPHVAASMNALALVLQSRRQYEEAEQLFRDALKMRKKLLPPGHYYIAISLNNLACVLWDRSKRDEAEPLLREAVDMAKENPREHSMIVAFNEHLAQLLTEEGKLKDAGNFYEDAKQYSKQRYGEDSLDYSQALYRLLKNVIQQGDFVRAEPLARECLALRERLQPGEWETFHVRALLGESLAGQLNFTEGESALVAACEGMQETRLKVPAAAQILLRQSLTALVKLYKDTNRTDKAAEWQRKLEELKAAGSTK